MFVDKVEVHVKAGDGGNGYSSFRTEKFIDRGGPDGGDGGRGGNVILVADPNTNTLLDFRFKQDLKAQSGAAGFKRRQHGKNGEDLFVKVPIGTMIFLEGKQVADLVTNGQKVIVAKGGDGGFGNAHFKSSVRQAPRVAELGEKGEEFELTFELKLLADVGLVGFPNAGKSTFLSVVSNARPEIADYPFTTLTPNLGVADIDSSSLLIADIPGLIEGASEGKGLGDAFLRHIERTAVLVHLIDVYEDDVVAAYLTINAELEAHNTRLAERPQIVALTKIEGLDDEAVNQQLSKLQAVVPAVTPLMAISSMAHKGVTELLREAQRLVLESRAVEAALAKQAQDKSDDDVPVIELAAHQQERQWRVLHDGGRFVITGHKIEKFAARTDFDSEPGLRRFRDIMNKMGISHELARQGAKDGDAIVIGRAGLHTFTY